MDETHTIAAALPTADDDDQAEFHGRAPRPTDDEASRNPTLAAAWALAEANPSENLQALQVAAAEAEEAA